MMYEATRVPGVFERLPEKLRGIFWMRGNAIAEELLTLQYGEWFEDEQIFILPAAPFNWAWPVGIPKHAPDCGKLYSEDASKGFKSLSHSVSGGRAYALDFGIARPGQQT